MIHSYTGPVQIAIHHLLALILRPPAATIASEPGLSIGVQTQLWCSPSGIATNVTVGRRSSHTIMNVRRSHGRNEVLGFELPFIRKHYNTALGHCQRHWVPPCDMTSLFSTVGLADPNMAAAVKEKKEGWAWVPKVVLV